MIRYVAPALAFVAFLLSPFVDPRLDGTVRMVRALPFGEPA